MSSVYLGAAIDLASELNAFDEMSKILTESETFSKSVLFRPDRAYINAQNVANSPRAIDFIMKANDYALLNADLAVFFISKNVFSAGVAHEIEKRLSVPRTTYIIAEKVGLYTRGQVNRANEEYVYSSHRKVNPAARFARIYTSYDDFQKNFEKHFEMDDNHVTDWVFTGGLQNKMKLQKLAGESNE